MDASEEDDRQLPGLKYSIRIGGEQPNWSCGDSPALHPGRQPRVETVLKISDQSSRMTIAFGLIERVGARLHCTHVLVNGSGVLGKQ